MFPELGPLSYVCSATSSDLVIYYGASHNDTYVVT